MTLSITELVSGEGRLASRIRGLVAVKKRGLVPSILLDGFGPVADLAQAVIRWGIHCLVGEGR